jgi:predicted nucleic acid-binding protein
MKQRGRQSAVAKTVVVGGFGKRPDPPLDLTTRQAEIWREIVSSEDPAFFNTAALRAMLAEYCRRRDTGEGLSQIINAFERQCLKTIDGAKRYRLILGMRDVESRAEVTIATKLRLTNQSRYDRLTAATAARRAAKAPGKPWEA